MKRHAVLVAGLLSIAASLAWSTPSRAQAAAEAAVYSGPNRALIGTGLITFGLSYIPAVVVAGESSQPADHHLYIPVAGPWLDMANRPACGAGAMPCDAENVNRVLLATSGIFQGLGAVAVVTGLLTHETEFVTAAQAQKPSIHFSPAEMGAGGIGAAAFGSF